jgi:cell division septal protein FtsQ
MPLNFLRKILFPRQADWQRKKYIRIAFWVVVMAVLFAAFMGAVMFFINSKR